MNKALKDPALISQADMLRSLIACTLPELAFLTLLLQTASPGFKAFQRVKAEEWLGKKGVF